jgi:capsular exopolysaccharide synthesis family protein
MDQKAQLALIKSRKVIQAALLKANQVAFLKTEPDPAGWLEKQLQATFIEGSNYLRLSLTGENPQDLTSLVNAVKDAYLDEAFMQDKSKNVQSLNEIDRICSYSEERIQKHVQELRDLADALETTDPAALALKQKIAVEEYGAQRKEFVLTNDKLRDMKQKLVILEDKADRAKKKPKEIEIPESMLEDELTKDPSIIAQGVEIYKIEALIEKHVASSKVEAGSPLSERLLESDRKLLAAAKAELEKTRAARRDGIRTRLQNRLVDEAKFQVDHANGEMALLEKQAKAIDKDVKTLKEELTRIGLKAFELELKRNNFEQADAINKSLRAQKERLEVEVKSNRRRMSAYDADIPLEESKTRALTAAASGAAMFLFGIFGVSFREARARRISGCDEVEHELGMRVFGTLPLLPARVGTWGQSRTDAFANTLLVEAIDGVRATLLCDDRMQAHRLLMITSARGGEGKTMVAGQLAVSLARAGRRTLLVDCDLRRPCVHRLFDLAPQVGLGEVLRGETDLQSSIVPTQHRALWALPAGKNPQIADLAHSQTQMHQVFEGLRSQYDFILLDSCPILPVADSLIFGKFADGALLCVRPNLSQTPAVCAAFERLHVLGIQVLGVVVNGISIGSRDYHYSYLADTRMRGGGTISGELQPR